MAEDTPPPLKDWPFDLVVSSYDPYMPTRSGVSRGFVATSYNMLTADGKFRKRPRVIQSTRVEQQISVDRNGNRGSTDKLNGQSPGAILAHYEASSDTPYVVVVTSNEAFISDPSTIAVRNLTPVYRTGTVSITNGTTALSGSGTTWSTDGIKAGQLVQLPLTTGSWYSIDTVNSDTSITLKQTFTGTTLVNSTYEIRRTGRGDILVSGAPPVSTFARIFNGDLYYTYLEGTDNYCVVQVPNVFSSTTTGANASIIGGTHTTACFAGGGQVWTGGTVNELKGLELLPDGRVVIATTETSGGLKDEARVRYSSHLDVKVWNAAPGGYTSVVDLPGRMNTIARAGAYIYCHYDVGVVLAVQTGQDDPPLSFQKTPTVSAGATNGHAAVNTPFGQAYWTRDARLCLYDGANQSVLTQAPRFDMSASVNYGHMAYDEATNKIWLFALKIGGGYTNAMSCDLEGGQIAYHRIPSYITAAADSLSASADDLILGFPSYDPNASGSGGVTSTMLYVSGYSSDPDVTPVFSVNATFGMQWTTDWQDCNLPGTDKIISHILLYYEGAASSAFTVTITGDNLTTWTATKTISSTSGEEKIQKLFFVPHVTEKFKLNFASSVSSTTSWGCLPQRMLIKYTTRAGMEAVER